jgi:hypothetical protein
MMRYMVWATVGAVIASMFGLSIGLYQMGEAQVLVAGAIGGALALIAAGKPVEPSFTRGLS